MSEEISNEINSNPIKLFKYQRPIQNFILIWLDSNLIDDNFQQNIVQLQDIINTIYIFTNRDKCIDFLSNIKNEKIFLILSNPMDQFLINLIDNFEQLDSIYLFFQCDNSIEKLSKVKGAFSTISSMNESLIKITQQCDNNFISMSFITNTNDASNQNFNELDQTFMYTQLLKEILFEIEFDKNSIKDFANYCRNQLTNIDEHSNNINKFEQEYDLQSPIWWYTSPTFIYSMLNRALRIQEVDIIIKMSFFICDLHRHIEQLHSEQFINQSTRIFTVYRGQGMSKCDFDKMLKAKGGLISFNNFLSTSEDRNLSFMLAESNAINSDLIGILFEINIDTSIKTAPFANVDNVSYFRHQEHEILFSMHTIFRIGEIKELDNSNRLWQVELKMTTDNDQLLKILTKRMRQETQGSTGWIRLGHLLIKLGQFNKAEEVYRVLLDDNTSEDIYKAHIYQQLGLVKGSQGDYDKAISFFVKALQIDKKLLPSNHPELATLYHNFGLVYYHLADYSKALLFYEKTLEITKQIVSPDHSDLATSYNNIGSIYDNMGEYPKALLYYVKALEIKEKILPSNHPSLCTSYNNIGLMYDNLGEYSKALLFHQKALSIREKILPPDHPDLATSYNNIGLLYNNMGEYSKVLSFYQKALEVKVKMLPTNHPSLNTSYNNIGSAYKNMGEYMQALSSYKKALEICQNSLPLNHPDYAFSYNNIGSVYDLMNECSEALKFYEKALKIRQESLPLNHIDFAYSYNNIARVYIKMGDYVRGIAFGERALEVFRCSLPSNHPHIQSMEENMKILRKKI